MENVSPETSTTQQRVKFAVEKESYLNIHFHIHEKGQQKVRKFVIIPSIAYIET